MVHLRQGAPADLDAVVPLMAVAFDPRFGEAWTQAQCMGVLSLPGVWLTLGEVNERIAGFALLRIAADEAELLLLAVDPAQRRCGIGGALLRAAVRDCRDRGARKLHLEVRSGNDAVNLYRRYGFEKTGVRPRYYRGADGDVFDAHSFSLEL